ncbi:MAG: hypothetical protein Fur0018_17420 [Anaerolineales bacterium]
MKKPRRYLFSVTLVLVGMLLGWLLPLPRAEALSPAELVTYVARVEHTAALFQRMCRELLPTTPLGQHYLDLGYRYFPEMGALLWFDQTTTDQTWRVIDLYSPAVEALLDGKGEDIYITQEMVDELLTSLSLMEARAGDELQQIIQEERASVPWSDMAGLTVAEAWEKLQTAAPASPASAAPTAERLPTGTPIP